jgi:site-specific recombinase XerD
MYAYSALIRELVQLNFLREGVQFLIRMDAEGVKMTPQVFNIVLHAYAKQGSIESTRRTHMTRHTAPRHVRV